jgi:phage terminase small subunit
MQMPILSNPRHERFAQFLAQGKKAVEAYELAGYRRDDGNAVRLTKKPAVTGRVQELTGKTAEKSGVTAESLMKEAEEARVAAMASGQHSAAVSAIREKGVLSGHRIERREVGPPDSFETMTDEELEHALIERIKAIGLFDAGAPNGGDE